MRPGGGVFLNRVRETKESFSKKNAYLRRHRDLALRDPRRAIAQAMESITTDDAAGYYRHAGFNNVKVKERKKSAMVPGI